MRKLVIMMVVSAFALSLAACAPMGGHEKMMVKCPSCGYEFPVETN